MRSLLLCAACTLGLLGCDPSYTLHLSTNVTAQGARIEGAWIIPLSRTSTRLGEVVGVRTGADGTALLSRTEFLRQPIGDAVAVRAAGRPTCVVRPSDTTTQRGRGIFFVTEYDADLAVDLASCPPSKRVALACGDATCDVALDETAGAFCDGWIVAIDARRATAAYAPETLANGTPATPRKWTFDKKDVSAFVAVCSDGRGQTSITVAE